MSTCLECPAEWLEMEMFRTKGDTRSLDRGSHLS